PDAVRFEAKPRQPLFVIRRAVKKIRLLRPSEKFTPAFEPHFGAQHEKNVVRVAFAAAGNDEPPARTQNRGGTPQKCPMIVHPVQHRTGKDNVEPRRFLPLAPPKRGEGWGAGI